MAKTKKYISEDTTGVTAGFVPKANGTGGIAWGAGGISSVTKGVIAMDGSDKTITTATTGILLISHHYGYSDASAFTKFSNAEITVNLSDNTVTSSSAWIGNATGPTYNGGHTTHSLTLSGSDQAVGLTVSGAASSNITMKRSTGTVSIKAADGSVSWKIL